MAANRVNQFRFRSDFREQFGRFLAVLFRILFKIHIMQKTRSPPECRIRAIAKLLRIPAHHPFDRQPMQKVEWLLIIRFQQADRLLPGHFRFQR